MLQVHIAGEQRAINGPSAEVGESYENVYAVGAELHCGVLGRAGVHVFSWWWEHGCQYVGAWCVK